MDTTQYASADETKKALAARVSSELRSFRKDETPVFLFFSGGSALGVFDALDADCAGPYLTLAPIDERYDPTRETSNFEAFAKTAFYESAKIAGADFLDTRVQEGEGRDGLAERFENGIRKWVSEHPEGRMITILGIGPDGHTAGIFPDDDEASFRERFQGDRWVVGYRGPESATCPERVTVTVSFIATQLHQAYVFLSGEEKRSAWEDVLEKRKPLHRLPALLLHDLSFVKAFPALNEKTI